MARRPDPAKTRLWSDRLKRFSDSSQTVTDFCRSEGVSVSAFHYWKRRLKNHALPTPNDALTTAPFLPVRLAEAAAPVPCPFGERVVPAKSRSLRDSVGKAGARGGLGPRWSATHNGGTRDPWAPDASDGRRA